MSALERLWKDRMEIYRYEEYTENNVTKSRKVPVTHDVKCHLSKGSLSDTGETEVPTIRNSYTLFCGLNAGIAEGDEVIVTKPNGSQITLSVGEGFPYSDHQEFSVKRSGTV